MNTLDHFRRLFTFDAWANTQVLESLERAAATPEDRATQTLAHILAAKEIWLARIQGRPMPGFNVFPTAPLSEVRAKHEEIDVRLWPAQLAALDEEGLAQTVAYHALDGSRHESRRADILTQLIGHGAHHRGQIASHLRAAGHAPPRVDFILWARMAG